MRNLLSMLSPERIPELLIRAVVVLFAMSVHELAHGYAAYRLGDPTAKSMGRLSLNPLRHLDPIGAICLLLFRVGWAKPVMVDPRYFKRPKRDMAITSLAGPVANFLLAFVAILLWQICLRFLPASTPYWLAMLLIQLLSTTAGLNIGLGVFNLLPIPPLDGSKVFLAALPDSLYYDIMRYERFGWIILVVALALGVLDPIIGGVIQGVFNAMAFLVSWI